MASFCAYAQELEETAMSDSDDPLVRKVEQRVEMLRKWRILEELNPDEALADALFPLLSHFSRREHELAAHRGELLRDLAITVHEPHTDARRCEDILRALRTNDQERCQLMKEKEDELNGLLSVEQHARLIVVLEEFNNEVRELIHQARRRPEPVPRRP
jgi:hypothetical protein